MAGAGGAKSLRNISVIRIDWRERLVIRAGRQNKGVLSGDAAGKSKGGGSVRLPEIERGSNGGCGRT